MCYGALRLTLLTGSALIRGRGFVMERRRSGITTKRQVAMFKHTKVRQAGLIVFATTLLLILPNLTKVIG